MAKHEPQFRDRRKPGWFYLDDAVIDQYGPSIGPYGIAVYTGLARHANAQGETSVGYDRLGTTLAISRNKVISTLRSLESKGLITIESQTDESGNAIAANIYTLCVIPEQKQLNGSRGVPHSGRGVPQDAPPHASDESPHAPDGTGGVPPDGQGVPPGACEGIVPNQNHHGSDSGSNARVILRDCGLYNGTIRQILALGIDEPTLIASVQNLASAGWGSGAIANELRDNPPVKGHPYAKPEPARSGNAAAERKPSERIGERPTLPAGLKFAGRRSAE